MTNTEEGSFALQRPAHCRHAPAGTLLQALVRSHIAGTGVLRSESHIFELIELIELGFELIFV
jgi:hypothetical protein